jgi:diguanylate cyclase
MQPSASTLGWFCALLLWLSMPIAHAGAVNERLMQSPRSEAVSCDIDGPTLWQRYEVSPPEGGWSGEPVAVLVHGAPTDRVQLSQGARVYCGQFGDAARMDSRFHTGVGGVFVPTAGSMQPIVVHVLGPDLTLWPIVMTSGPPAAVQRQDSYRFGIRVGILAVMFSVVISTLLAFAVARESALLIFPVNSTVVFLWIALMTGVSGFPSAWLPVGEWRIRLLVGLPIPMVVSTLSLMLSGREVRRKLLWLPGLGLAMGIFAFALLVFSLSIDYGLLAQLALIVDLLAVSLLVIAAMFNLWWFRRAHSSTAMGNVVAVLPLIVAGCVGWTSVFDAAPWKVEWLAGAVAWIGVASSAVLLLRLGNIRRQRDTMRRLAETDSLTGLANRRAAMGELERRVAESARDRSSLGVIFIDIDHFKAVNDAHGHAMGDAVLIAVGERLRGLVRTTDMVARLGGEEFLLILPGADEATCLRLGQRCGEDVAAIELPSEHGVVRVTVSVGVASRDRHPDANATEMLGLADKAMYAAKIAGRNRVFSATHL